MNKTLEKKAEAFLEALKSTHPGGYCGRPYGDMTEPGEATLDGVYDFRKVIEAYERLLTEAQP